MERPNTFFNRKFVVAICGASVAAAVFFVSAAEAVAPTPPFFDSAIATSSCAVDLGFRTSGSEPVTYFKAKRQKTGSPSFVTISLPGAPATGCEIVTPGLPTLRCKVTDTHTSEPIIDPAQSYIYKLQSCNGDGCSTDSAPRSVTTLPLSASGAAPSIINSTPSAIASRYVTIEWDAITPEPEGFQVWLTSSTNGGATFLSYNPSPTYDELPGYTTLQDVNVPNVNWAHKIKLNAITSGGLGCDPTRPEHTGASAADEIIVPARPQNVAAIYNQAADSINVTWDDSSTGEGDEEDFEVWRGVGASYPVSLVATLSRGTTSYTDASCGAGTTCFYRVRACRGTTLRSCSFYSELGQASTGIATPSDLEARLVKVSRTTGKGYVNLSWNDRNIDESGFTVERADVSSGIFSPIVLGGCEFRLLGRNINECTDEIRLGADYKYRVLARKDLVFSPPSNEIVVKANVNLALQGQAWSAITSSLWSRYGGIGWVDFNSTDNKYSVHVHTDGSLSGLAWADNGYGWVSFDPLDLQGCPSGTCNATLTADNKLTGWARFYSAVAYKDEPTYSGWVSFGDGSGAPPPPPVSDTIVPVTVSVSNAVAVPVTYLFSKEYMANIAPSSAFLEPALSFVAALFNTAQGAIAPGGGGGGGDEVIPNVSISSPASGVTVSGMVTANANASDTIGVVGVQFKLDGGNLGVEDTAAPYGTTFDTTLVANGLHSLTAVARDAAGNRTTSASVSINVLNAIVPAAYGVSYNSSTKTFSGLAWGGEVVGWLAFSRPECLGNCTVIADDVVPPPPELLGNVRVAEGPYIEPERSGATWCSSDPYYSLYWDYNGVVDLQLADLVFLDSANNSALELFVYDGDPFLVYSNTFSGKTYKFDFNDPLGYNTNGIYNGLGDFLETSTSYRLAVRVQDTSGTWTHSGIDPRTWAISPGFVTPSHYAPLVDFRWSPSEPTTGVQVDMSGDRTLDRSESAYPEGGWSWLWNFTADANPTSASTRDATVRFGPSVTSTTTIKLSVDDNSPLNVSCTANKEVIGESSGVIGRRLRETGGQ